MNFKQALISTLAVLNSLIVKLNSSKQIIYKSLIFKKILDKHFANI